MIVGDLVLLRIYYDPVVFIVNSFMIFQLNSVEAYIIISTLPTADSCYSKPSPRLWPGINIFPEIAAQSAQGNQAFCVTTSDWSALFSVKIKMAAPMEVSLPQTMLQKLLDLLKLESLKFCLKIHVHVTLHISCKVNIDYHNQHESA